MRTENHGSLVRSPGYLVCKILSYKVGVMRDKLFPIFITLLGLLTAYAFYALWHTEELSSPTEQQEQIKEKQVIDLANKKIIPRQRPIVSIPEVSLESPKISKKTEKKTIEEIEKHEKLVFQLSDKLEEKTQTIYDSLIPEEHEEIMAEASEAFDRLDELVSTQDDKQELLEDEVMNIANENLDYATQEEEEIPIDEIPAFIEEEIAID